MAKKISKKKQDYLKSKVEHIDITKINAVDIVNSMKKMSFSARDLAVAADMYNRMLADRNCVIFLTIAGSTSAAGCMQIYADMVRYNMVDAIVATGASIVDMDFFEALGFQPLPGHAPRRRQRAAQALHRPDLRHLHRRGAAAGLRQDRQEDRRRA